MNIRLEKKKETIKKHSKMLCKVFQIKFQKLSKDKLNYFNRLFVEAKWFYNDILASENVFNYDYKINFSIIKNQIKEYEVRNLIYLSSQMKQSMLDRLKSNIKMLKTKKDQNKFDKIGKLKFKSEINSIPLKQFNITYKILNNNKIQIQGSPFKNGFRVKGLGQIPTNVDICNATLVRKTLGFFIYITCYVEKEKINKKDYIGLDFGLKNSITDSKGNSYNFNIPESEKLKRLQVKLFKQFKYSKRWYKTLKLIKKEYEKINNRKNDITNKFINSLKSYKIIAIQDEQISNWHKSNMKGWSKKIQHSILGRIKSKLKLLETTKIVDKFLPTTKECPFCKTKNNTNLQTEKNIYYSCNCGYKELRDIHSAKNILRFALEQLGMDDAFRSLSLRSQNL